jgi:hypothetical protein
VVWRFIVTPTSEPRPATLVLDQSGAVTIEVVKHCLVFFACQGPAIAVHARDKSGNAKLEGVSARLEPGLKLVGPNQDLAEHLAIKFNRTTVDDFFARPQATERDVAAGSQATIALAFHDLESGEYTIPLRVTARNSAEDDQQRLTVTLKVREHWWIAVLVLLVAAAFSFVATRVVTVMRQRARFLRRLRGMRPAWLAQELPILPVTWLRATLRLADDLSRRYWLTGQSEIETRLTDAENMLTVLDGVRQVRERIAAISEFRVQQRAAWRLDLVVQRIPAAALTTADVTRFTAELAGFDAWSDPDAGKREAAYWADLVGAVRARYSEVRVEQLPHTARDLGRVLHNSLRDALTNTPPTLDNKIKVQEDYERLTILWEVRGRSNWVTQLIALHPVQGGWEPIERVYGVVDDGRWEILRGLPAGALTIEAPASTLDPPEAYETVVFTLCGDTEPGLLSSYLMQKKVRYEWTVEVEAARWWRQPINRGNLTPRSREPKVAQFSPHRGRLTASVRITYPGRPGEVRVPLHPAVPAAVTIAPSGDFGVMGIFERSDVLAFLAALGASIITGVSLHGLASTFGASLADYIALFTWGAGVDQGKNFIQSLVANSPAAPQPAAPARAAAP